MNRLSEQKAIEMADRAFDRYTKTHDRYWFGYSQALLDFVDVERKTERTPEWLSEALNGGNGSHKQ